MNHQTMTRQGHQFENGREAPTTIFAANAKAVKAIAAFADKPGQWNSTPALTHVLIERERRRAYREIEDLPTLMDLHEKGKLYTGATKLVATDAHVICVAWLGPDDFLWQTHDDIASERLLLLPDKSFLAYITKAEGRRWGYYGDLFRFYDTDEIVKSEADAEFTYPDYERIMPSMHEILTTWRLGMIGILDGRYLGMLNTPLANQPIGQAAQTGFRFYHASEGDPTTQMHVAINKARSCMIGIMPLRFEQDAPINPDDLDVSYKPDVAPSQRDHDRPGTGHDRPYNQYEHFEDEEWYGDEEEDEDGQPAPELAH